MTRPLEHSHVAPSRVIQQRPRVRFRPTVKKPGDHYFDGKTQEWKVVQ